MPLAVRRATACILIILLAIVSGVGEGLHWIPGCGHGVPIGNTVMWLGISVPDTRGPADDRPHVGRPQDQDIPVYSEDQCAICSAVGQNCTSVDSAPLPLVVPLVQDLPPVAVCVLPATTIRPSQARAPPLV